MTKGTQTITFGPLPDRDLGAGSFAVTATSSTGGAVTFTTTTPRYARRVAVTARRSTSSPPAPAPCTPTSRGTRSSPPPRVRSQSFGVGEDRAGDHVRAARPTRPCSKSPVTVSASAVVAPAGDVHDDHARRVHVGRYERRDDHFSSRPERAPCRPTRPGTTPSARRRPSRAASPSPSRHRRSPSAALAARTTPQSPVTVGATASSGLAVTFTTTTPLVCTLGRDQRHDASRSSARGPARFAPTRPGTRCYGAADPVSQSFAVTKTDQTITFGAAPRPDRVAYALDGQRDRVVGPGGDLHDDHTARVHGGRDQRHEHHATRGRHVYGRSRPGGERRVQRRARGAAELHGCEGRSDHHVRCRSSTSPSRHRR